MNFNWLAPHDVWLEAVTVAGRLGPDAAFHCDGKGVR